MNINEIKNQLLERLKVYRDRENACYEWSTGIVSTKPEELFYLDSKKEADNSHIINACCADEIDFILELLKNN
jgi:hypothetical protein